MRLARACFLIALSALAACGAEESPPQEQVGPRVAFDTGRLAIASGADTVHLPIEIAVTDEQRAYGLMERSSLPEEAGMIFWYPEMQPDSAVFWMFRTRIPLDIAFVDSAGVIQTIRSMPPCASPYPQWCARYPAGAPFRGALEVNQGYFSKQGIQVGDRLLLESLNLSSGAR